MAVAANVKATQLPLEVVTQATSLALKATQVVIEVITSPPIGVTLTFNLHESEMVNHPFHPPVPPGPPVTNPTNCINQV